MARNYANRKPKKSAGGSRAKSRGKSANSARLPILPWLIAVALVSGFGYFLWSINGSSEQTETVEAKTNKATKAETTKKAEPKPDPNALPPKPKENWTYTDSLVNKTVEVDVPKSGVVSSGIYQLQCGSFRQESQANQMKARIAFMGMEAQVRRTEGSNGVWYRVIIAPFPSKRDAETGRHKLQSNGINTCQIRLWE